MAAIATTRQPDATKMPAGGNADGRLHTFNDLRMRLRQNLPFDQWTGVQCLMPSERWRRFGNVVQEMVFDNEIYGVLGVSERTCVLTDDALYLVNPPGETALEQGIAAPTDQAIYVKLSVILAMPLLPINGQAEFTRYLEWAIEEVAKGEDVGGAGVGIKVTCDNCCMQGSLTRKPSSFMFTLVITPGDLEPRVRRIGSSKALMAAAAPVSMHTHDHVKKCDAVVDRLTRVNIGAALHRRSRIAARCAVHDVRTHSLGAGPAKAIEVIPLNSIQLPIQRKKHIRDSSGGAWWRRLWARRTLRTPRHLQLTLMLDHPLHIADQEELVTLIDIYRSAFTRAAADALSPHAPDAPSSKSFEACLDNVEFSFQEEITTDDAAEAVVVDEGEEGSWDIFLSYRVAADADLVERLYDKLSNCDHANGTRKLKVFWDRKCLTSGQSWELSFARALCCSQVVVPVCSRRTFCLPGAHDMDQLTADGKADSVLLEWDMTLELLALGRARAIHPIFIGDDAQLVDAEGGVMSNATMCVNYHESGCRQRGAPVVVESVRKKALSYLASAGLETSEGGERVNAMGAHALPTLAEGRTVEQIIDGIHKFQGSVFVGVKRDAIDKAVNDVHETVLSCASSSLDATFASPQGPATANLITDTLNVTWDSTGFTDQAILQGTAFSVEALNTQIAAALHRRMTASPSPDLKGLRSNSSGEVSEGSAMEAPHGGMEAALKLRRIKCEVVDASLESSPTLGIFVTKESSWATNLEQDHHDHDGHELYACAIKGRNILDPVSLTTNDPYMKMQVKSTNGVFVDVYQSDIFFNESNPEWEPILLHLQRLDVVMRNLEKVHSDRDTPLGKALTVFQTSVGFERGSERYLLSVSRQARAASSMSGTPKEGERRMTLGSGRYWQRRDRLKVGDLVQLTEEATRQTEYSDLDYSGMEAPLGLIIEDFDKETVTVNFDFQTPTTNPGTSIGDGTAVQRSSETTCNRSDLVLIPCISGDTDVIFETWGKSTPLQKLFRLQGRDRLFGTVHMTFEALLQLAYRRSGCSTYTIGVDQMNAYHPFTIRTQEQGHNSGRSYTLRTRTSQECQHWVQALSRHTQHVQRQQLLSQWWEDAEGSIVYQVFVLLWRLQARVKDFYDSKIMNVFVNATVISAFCTSIIKWEVVPLHEDATEYPLLDRTLESLETFYTVAFSTELMINAFSNWFRPFFRSVWTYLDILVVSVSIVSEFSKNLEMGPALRVIRVFRLMRILKLVKAFGSLQSMVSALFKAAVPVANALMILLLTTSVMAIVATSFFADQDSELFGTFSKSFFTMWQVGTGDHWSEIARGAAIDADGNFNALVVFFFSAHAFFVGIMLTNIVIAILLHEFLATTTADKIERWKEIQTQVNESNGVRPRVGALDSLLQVLCKNTTAEELSQMLDDIFTSAARGGYINYLGLKLCLKKLGLHLNLDDWQCIFGVGDSASETGERNVDKKEFEAIMRKEMHLFLVRQHLNAMIGEGGQGQDASDTHVTMQRSLKFLTQSSLLDSLVSQSAVGQRETTSEGGSFHAIKSKVRAMGKLRAGFKFEADRKTAGGVGAGVLPAGPAGMEKDALVKAPPNSVNLINLKSRPAREDSQEGVQVQVEIRKMVKELLEERVREREDRERERLEREHERTSQSDKLNELRQMMLTLTELCHDKRHGGSDSCPRVRPLMPLPPPQQRLSAFGRESVRSGQQLFAVTRREEERRADVETEDEEEQRLPGQTES